MEGGHTDYMSEISTTNRKLIVSVLMAGAFVTILNQTLMLIAIPPIMHEFGIDPSMGQWLTTAFLLTNGILIPISAFLIEKFSTRALLFAALLIFFIGTLVGALAPNFATLLLARVIQAGGAGIMMPLMQTVMLTIYPPEKRGSAMGMFGLVIAFAPAIGPTLSGFIIDHFTWRYLFYIVLPITVLTLIFAIIFMKNVTSQRATRVDMASIIFSTFGWGGLLYGFSIAGRMGWDSIVVHISIGIGLLTLTVFIWRQFKLQRPMLEFRVFRYRMFSMATFLTVLVFALMVGTQTILPIYAQDIRAYSALHSGVLLLPGAVIMGIMNPIAGKLFDRFGGRWLSIIGFASMMISEMMFMSLGLHTPIIFIAIMFMFMTAGISLVMMPLTTAGINVLPNELIAHGTAMINTIRMVGGSIGTAILISIMSSATATNNTLSNMLGGMHSAFLVASLIGLVGFLASFTIHRKQVSLETSR